MSERRKAKSDPKRLDKLRLHVDEARSLIDGALDDLSDEVDWAAADELLRQQNYQLVGENEKLSNKVHKLELEVSDLRDLIEKAQQDLAKANPK